MNNQIKTIAMPPFSRLACEALLLLSAAALLTGCRKSQPAPTTQQITTAQPTVATATTKPVDPNAGVVVKKPFIAWRHPFAKVAQPSVLLQQHARSDSPIPLSEYANQGVHTLASFNLRADLSAAELQLKLGLPAQLADYSDPWFVYRLTGGKELWLHFSQPDNAKLTTADEIFPVEDGYTRKRVFSIDDSN